MLLMIRFFRVPQIMGKFSLERLPNVACGESLPRIDGDADEPRYCGLEKIV